MYQNFSDILYMPQINNNTEIDMFSETEQRQSTKTETFSAVQPQQPYAGLAGQSSVINGVQKSGAELVVKTVVPRN
jgi:hypothetical protein